MNGVLQIRLYVISRYACFCEYVTCLLINLLLINYFSCPKTCRMVENDKSIKCTKFRKIDQNVDYVSMWCGRRNDEVDFCGMNWCMASVIVLVILLQASSGLSLLRQVFQGAAASLFLKPSQSALLYSQTCLGGGVSDSGEASSRAWTR